jgi:hypothetical protein
MTASVVYWSEFVATDPEARVRFHYQQGEKKPERERERRRREGVEVLERGPLSLVSTTEELLDRKGAAPV